MQENMESSIRAIIEQLKKMSYVKPEEIPNIDLYMDQVTTFIEAHLKSFKRHDDDKLLTKTMINNYTKNNLLPAPDKKKYTKEHMFLLIFIYYFKNFLSIGDIQKILTPLTENFYDADSNITLESIYEEVFSLEQDQIESLTKDLIRKLKKSEDTFSDEKYKENRNMLTKFSFICMLSFDVYIKKMIIEKLLDEPDGCRPDSGKEGGKEKKK